MTAEAGLVLGIDAGGTKLHALVADTEGAVIHEEFADGSSWNLATVEERARVIAGVAAPWGSRLDAIGIGAHGCDSERDCERLQRAMRRLLPAPAKVVNDAELLGYAEGHSHAINVVLGTGSIVLSRNVAGEAAYVGGWGWLIGDDGSAWGIVRAAIRALTLLGDEASVEDQLTAQILERTGALSLRDVVSIMQARSASAWASWADTVFSAASDGSPSACAAVDGGVASTVELVRQAHASNPDAALAVLAGGVVTRQEAYAQRIIEGIREVSGIEAVVLGVAPVQGALRLAAEVRTFHSA